MAIIIDAGGNATFNLARSIAENSTKVQVSDTTMLNSSTLLSPYYNRYYRRQLFQTKLTPSLACQVNPTLINMVLATNTC